MLPTMLEASKEIINSLSLTRRTCTKVGIGQCTGPGRNRNRKRSKKMFYGVLSVSLSQPQAPLPSPRKDDFMWLFPVMASGKWATLRQGWIGRELVLRRPAALPTIHSKVGSRAWEVSGPHLHLGVSPAPQHFPIFSPGCCPLQISPGPLSLLGILHFNRCLPLFPRPQLRC